MLGEWKDSVMTEKMVDGELQMQRIREMCKLLSIKTESSNHARRNAQARKARLRTYMFLDSCLKTMVVS